MPDARDVAEPQPMLVLNIPVSVINLQSTVCKVLEWCAEPRVRIIFVRDVASLMVSTDDELLRSLHHKADLVVPDGMPLVWLGRIRGYRKDIGRVAGADLVDALCKASIAEGRKHFYYGGKPGVAAEMARRLSARYPGLRVAGVVSPPVRSIGAQFQVDEAIKAEVDMIRDSDADIIWVGLSSPKQEYLMMKIAPHFTHGVFIGVGAAFDFQSGVIERAPRWMQEIGLEWLHRLLREPRRLWRRYLVLAPMFLLRLIVSAYR